MKANAPEKLYVDVRDNLSDSILYGFTGKSTDDDIENTRTDAFIEKACDWLRTHREMDFFELIPVGNYCGAGNLNKKKMIEDFRNYMKGESYEQTFNDGQGILDE